MAVHYGYVPQPPLATFIESFWLYEGDSLPHTRERRLPDGATELVINLREDLTRVYDRRNHDAYRDCGGAVLSGPHSTFTLLDARCLVSALGVHFRPGGMLPFLPFPTSELRDQVLSLETIWGQQAVDLRGRLCEATTPAARFSLLERFLLGRLDLTRTSHPAVARAASILEDVARAPGVASIAAHLGLSQTRLIQVFRDAVGLTPKRFARLCRFQHALRALDAGRVIAWGDVVAAGGYFDQSHLIHEFQTFAGLTPSAYLALRGEYRNHVPLLT